MSKPTPANSGERKRFRDNALEVFERGREALLFELGEPPWTFESLNEFEELLRRTTNVSRSTFYAYLAELKECGYITVTPSVEVNVNVDPF